MLPTTRPCGMPASCGSCIRIVQARSISCFTRVPHHRQTLLTPYRRVECTMAAMPEESQAGVAQKPTGASPALQSDETQQGSVAHMSAIQGASCHNSCESSSESDSDSDSCSSSSDEELEGPCECGQDKVIDKAAREQLKLENKQQKHNEKMAKKEEKQAQKEMKKQSKAKAKMAKEEEHTLKKQTTADVLSDGGSSSDSGSNTDTDSDL